MIMTKIAQETKAGKYLFFLGLNETFIKPVTKLLEHSKSTKMLAIAIENVLERFW